MLDFTKTVENSYYVNERCEEKKGEKWESKKNDCSNATGQGWQHQSTGKNQNMALFYQQR